MQRKKKIRNIRKERKEKKKEGVKNRQKRESWKNGLYFEGKTVDMDTCPG